jgi:hypothetical protein
MIVHYQPNEVPYWISQPYDEQDFLEGGINDWGSTKRGNGFDYWAGGTFWIKPSPDRVAMSEDTRFIFSPEDNDIISLTMVHPIDNERTLAGIFKSTRTGIYYYNLRQLNLISGTSAEDYIESKLPAREKGSLFGTMPLLYNVEGRLIWYVPIYWAEEGEKAAASGTITFEGLGVVDASDSKNYHIELVSEGVNPQDISVTNLVKKARIEFLKTLQGTPVTQELKVNGTLTSINQDIVEINGKTTTEWLLSLKMDNGTTTNVWAYSINLDKETRTKLMLLKVGDRASIEVDEENDMVQLIEP